ncbi:hypothetical protein BOTNAR_0048g00420 [Botryotinia narcissicola]|uniref:Uncharacterized protein n=1 Tax=Botryotinia narcissicola TaxID=278944 RepID=A0A4Z1J6B4_9HELO|nr:hypothetical protein BOTNAR_0048g00420 [Botryotinia narcissicola]
MLLSPTLYQKKYGVPPTPIAIIIGSHRSGLTLISAYDLINPSANASREERTAYQQSRLRGYTSQLLVYLDVVSLRSLTIPEDSNPINQTMQRSRWVETSDLVLPISSSEAEGISWTAQNPLIWEHLQPCLRLASRLLTRMHLDPFVQALLLGNTETIPIEEFKSQDTRIKSYRKKILMRHYTLGFGVDESAKSQGDEGMESSAPLKQSFVAVSTYNRQNMTIVTEYNVYSFRVLMNPSLSDVERLSEECMYLATLRNSLPMETLSKGEIKEAVSHGALYEPMWRREKKSEVGWAGEAPIFGGTHSKILYNKITTGPGLGSTLDPWPEYDAARHGDTPQLVLPLGSTWASPLPIHMHTQFRSEDFWSLYARKYGLFNPVNSIGYAHAITIEDDYAKDIDYQYKVVLPSNFNGSLSPVSVITPTLHAFSKPSKRTYAEYLLLNRDGRMDKAKTLQIRLGRFRDLFHEINATMHQQSKTLMDYAWLFAYFEEPPEPEYEEADRRRLSPECDYAPVVADNASSAQKNKAVFEGKLQRARAPLAYMDVASLEPLCNQLLHDDLGAALKPALRAELFTLLTKSSDEEKQSALDKRDELQEYINEAKNL